MTTFTAATHDGVFHADDVFGAAILRRVTPDITIIRTRDPQRLAEADIRFDVGGNHNPQAGNYDHHQIGGAGVRPHGVPYASAGLLWHRFGVGICGDMMVAAEVDRHLIQSIDAHDNGYAIMQPMGNAVTCTVSHIISNFNPAWDEPQESDRTFDRAVVCAATILDRAIVHARGVVVARTLVDQAVADAFDPRIVVLDRFVPWQGALCAASAEARYVVYPSAGTWRVQVVPHVPGQPGGRTSLPEAWAGLDGAALAQVSGVPDATFAHRGRFIAGAQSREGAYALAMTAVRAPYKESSS